MELFFQPFLLNISISLPFKLLLDFRNQKKAGINPNDLPHRYTMGKGIPRKISLDQISQAAKGYSGAKKNLERLAPEYLFGKKVSSLGFNKQVKLMLEAYREQNDSALSKNTHAFNMLNKFIEHSNKQKLSRREVREMMLELQEAVNEGPDTKISHTDATYVSVRTALRTLAKRETVANKELDTYDSKVNHNRIESALVLISKSKNKAAVEKGVKVLLKEVASNKSLGVEQKKEVFEKLCNLQPSTEATHRAVKEYIKIVNRSHGKKALSLNEVYYAYNAKKAFQVLGFSNPELITKKNTLLEFITKYDATKIQKAFGYVLSNSDISEVLDVLASEVDGGLSAVDNQLPLLHWAIMKGQAEVAKVIVDKLSVDQLMARGKDGLTALHMAVMKGDIDVLSALVKKLPTKELGVFTDLKMTPLHIALAKNDTKAALLLIDKMSTKQLNAVFSNKQNLPSIYNKEVLNALYSKGCIPVESIKRNLYNFLSLEANDTKVYEGHTSNFIHTRTMEQLVDFLKSKDGAKEGHVCQVLQGALCTTANLSEKLQGLLDLPAGQIGALYLGLFGDELGAAGHQIALLRKGDDLFLLNEGGGSHLLDVDKGITAGVVKINLKVLNDLKDVAEQCKGKIPINQYKKLFGDAVMSSLDEDWDGNLIKEVDKQWIGNCSVASMRLLLGELFEDKELFKEFTLYQRIEAVKEFQDMVQRLPKKQREKEVKILRMAQAKVLHLCGKRMNFEGIKRVAVEEFGIPDDSQKLQQFFKECLDNEDLPYDDSQGKKKRINDLREKHKADYSFLLGYLSVKNA